MKPTHSGINSARSRTDDPVLLLRNEHTVLLGQLQLLERDDMSPGKASNVLKTLWRDSRVHFKRETILLNALGPKLGVGGESINALTNEHRELRHKVSRLLKQIAQLDDQSESSGNYRLRILLRGLTKQFRSHIRHEEKVVYVLVLSRLTPQQRRTVTKRMLVE